MITQEFIQAEYERFCTGKLYFEIIFPDTFQYLYSCGLLNPTEEQITQAIREVSEYRREVLRKWYMGKDKLLRDNTFPHIDTEAGRKIENNYRCCLVLKMIVFKWYESKKEGGVAKLFLELQSAV